MSSYKIKDIEILTGIKAHTIRIWEKRYGIRVPERSETKIRKYSDEDLVAFLNIAMLNKSGYKISRIASMTSVDIENEVKEIELSEGSDDQIENLILALLKMNEELFSTTLNFLIKKHGLVKTYSVYLTEFLRRTGIMWLVGTIDPAQEHFVSNIIRNKIIVEKCNLPSPKENADCYILFLRENEWHELSLLIYDFLLKEKGYKTIYLGQSVPLIGVLNSIEKFNPKALVTSFISSIEDDEMIKYISQFSLPVYAGGCQIDNVSLELPTNYKNTQAFLI